MSHCFRIKLLASFAIAAWLGCAPTDGPGARPVDTVILVSIDSLRADQPRDAAEDSNSEATIDPATQEHLRALGYVE
jgi:hypothetical protein